MIRKFLFLFFFFLGISLISILFLPTLLMPTKIVLFGGKLMGRWSYLCLQIFLKTKIIIKGRENIKKDQKFFIACSHQSMFETFFLQTVFNSPIFILKKELIKLPVFGWYLKKIGSISVNRNKISKDNLGLIRTQELIEARKIDGGKQFFSSALDFGYSKEPVETLNFWNEEKILSDFVWIIRKFRPDIIITRFNQTPYITHGHHTASAILASFLISSTRKSIPSSSIIFHPGSGFSITPFLNPKK